MELENVSVEIRPRTPWEAIDLGIILTRAFSRQIFPAWILISTTVFILLHIITGGRLFLSMLLFWWLKPAFDRFLLQLFSKALFGAPPTMREAVKGSGDIFSTGLWINLTLLRFNPSRSFHLPVWMLEGLRGESRVSRIRTLTANIRSYPLWLTISCQTMEFVLEIAPLILLALLLPKGIDINLITQILSGDDTSIWVEISGSIFYYLAIVIIEPIYVASGFMLYIDRRTKLEGWDIELAFRRMAERLNSMQKSPSTALAALLFLIFLLPLNTDLQAAPSQQESNKVIESVLNQEEFNRSSTHLKWTPLWEQKKSPDEPEFYGNLKQLIDYIARVFRGLIWVAAGIGIIFLAYHHKKWLNLFGHRKKKAADPPRAEQLFGLDLTPQSLPENISKSARDLIISGEFRNGFSLLYRASLSSMQQHNGLKLKDSDSEGDVLTLARNVLSESQILYLERLTKLWQLTAYGNHQPDRLLAISLCDQWPDEFESTQ